MFFYEIEGHMQKLSSFGRVKKIRPKKSLRLDICRRSFSWFWFYFWLVKKVVQDFITLNSEGKRKQVQITLGTPMQTALLAANISGQRLEHKVKEYGRLTKWTTKQQTCNNWAWMGHSCSLQDTLLALLWVQSNGHQMLVSATLLHIHLKYARYKNKYNTSMSQVPRSNKGLD